MEKKLLKGKKFIVDAGHGGKDPGAVGPKGLTESETTLKLAYLIGYKLKEMGAEVVLTRPTEEFVTLKGRVLIAKEHKDADAFISIHCNAVDNKDVEGIETYYYKNSSISPELAEKIQKSMMEEFKEHNNRGTKGAGYYVTKYTPMAAALIEMEFISNPKIEEKLKNPTIIYRYVNSIVNGIVDYIN